jgi:hypothetical protein
MSPGKLIVPFTYTTQKKGAFRLRVSGYKNACRAGFAPGQASRRLEHLNLGMI